METLQGQLEIPDLLSLGIMETYNKYVNMNRISPFQWVKLSFPWLRCTTPQLQFGRVSVLLSWKKR